MANKVAVYPIELTYSIRVLGLLTIYVTMSYFSAAMAKERTDDPG